MHNCPKELCNRALELELAIGILVYLAACLCAVNVRTLGNDVVNDSCINEQQNPCRGYATSLPFAGVQEWQHYRESYIWLESSRFTRVVL